MEDSQDTEYFTPTYINKYSYETLAFMFIKLGRLVQIPFVHSTNERLKLVVPSLWQALKCLYPGQGFYVFLIFEQDKVN